MKWYKSILKEHNTNNKEIKKVIDSAISKLQLGDDVDVISILAAYTILVGEQPLSNIVYNIKKEVSENKEQYLKG